MISQTNPDIASVTAPMMVEDMDMDFAQKKKILDGLGQIQQQHAQQIQHEQQMAQAEMQLKIKTQQDQSDNKRRELDILAQNFTKLSITAKADGSTPSAVLTELLLKGGVEADPPAVASDYVAHRVINNDLDALNQRTYNANVPEYEKEAIKAKVAVKKKQGVDTPKDKSARSKKKVTKR